MQEKKGKKMWMKLQDTKKTRREKRIKAEKGKKGGWEVR